MNDSLIQELIGKKVQLYSVHGGGESQVVGTLEAFDGTFFKIRKDNDTLLFTVYQTRLVKNFL